MKSSRKSKTKKINTKYILQPLKTIKMAIGINEYDKAYELLYDRKPLSVGSSYPWSVISKSDYNNQIQTLKDILHRQEYYNETRKRLHSPTAYKSNKRQNLGFSNKLYRNLL